MDGNRFQYFSLFCLNLALFFGSGCSKTTATTKAFEFSAVAPIVNRATPPGLRSGTTARFSLRKMPLIAQLLNLFSITPAMATISFDSDVKDSLEAMFKGTFGKISGGSGTGYINSNLEDLDSRVDELESRFQSLPTCFSNTLKSHPVDFQEHADAQLTLQVQCRDVFNSTAAGEQSRPGSGMVFGRREKSASQAELVSLMLLLKHKTSTGHGGSDTYDAGFGYAGTLEAAGTDDEAVNMLFGQFNTTAGMLSEDYPLIARIYAKPHTNEFELALTGSLPNAGSPILGDASVLGCGFRMISNGTLIYAAGKKKTGAGDCSSGLSNFEVCVDATTLEDASATSASACNTLASTTFHVASSSTSLNTLVSTVLTDDTATSSEHIFDALQPDSTGVIADTSAVSN